MEREEVEAREREGQRLKIKTRRQMSCLLAAYSSGDVILYINTKEHHK